MRMVRGVGSGRPILQAEAAECGLACLAMIAAHHGCDLDLNSLRRRFGVSSRGVTIRALRDMSLRLGMRARVLRIELEHVRALSLPVVAHFDMDHFVVILRSRKGRFVIIDPAFGEMEIEAPEFDRRFTGVVLELSPGPDFEAASERSRLSMSELVGRVSGLRRALTRIVGLSVLLQLFVLASPYYVQLAVDRAATDADGGALQAIALGFGLVMLLGTVSEWLRSRSIARVGAVLDQAMAANLFHHMLRLPLGWFERRQVGDVLTRFASIQPIERFVSDGVIATVVDGCMALVTGVVILAYSPELGLIVIAGALLGGAWRAWSFGRVRRGEERTVRAQAVEQGALIETVRGMQALKVAGREADREDDWASRRSELSAARIGLEHSRASVRFGASLLQNLEQLLVVYLGAVHVMGGAFTVGMLFAFLGYRRQFVDAIGKLFDAAMQWRLLGLHLDRTADIALAEREPGIDTDRPIVQHEISGALKVRRVRFSYGEADAEVLREVSFEVDAGEFVAITGASGGGKSTLLRIMLGLVRPQSGDVLVDGIPLAHLGPASYRAQIAAVLQEDHLFAGSIAENISSFDAAMCLERVRESARLASVDDEIMAMPMNYSSLVGDMGSALSGGQRQRVLLARALYRRPRILFLDEGTSHLDEQREREVNLALASLRITRVVVAHRLETLRSADRVIRLHDGRILESLSQGSPVAC